MQHSFINSKKEIFFGDTYFKQVCGDCGFDWRAHKKELSPYFAERNFSVSGMYSDYYSYFNGFASDRYMSMDLYFFYALPCLNKRSYMQAYADKNNYELILKGIPQPRTVVKRRNGFYYDASEQRIDSEEAASIVSSELSDCIIKPTLDTGCGKGVELVDKRDVVTQFSRTGEDFIVQQKLEQCEILRALNPTSLNTMRVLTYRDVEGVIHFMHNQTFLRIGGKGSIKDNVGAGGGAGLCLVRDDGRVEDALVGHCTLERASVSKDHGVVGAVVPNFCKIIEFAKTLHSRIYYLDWIGWDIAVGVDREPVFVELNATPDIYGTQSVGGPMFGEKLDEVMTRISSVAKIKTSNEINVFRPGYDYVQQIAGPAYSI